MNKLQFLKNFFKDKDIAAVAPSSRFTVKKICQKIDFSKDRVVVEFGPGSGVLVKAALKKMTPGSRFIAIETNKKFADHLKSLGDDRLIVANDMAQNVSEILGKNGISDVDYAISSIPFSYLKRKVRDDIVRATHDVLKPGGRFIIYQATWHSAGSLKRVFGDFEMDVEMRNIPPFFFFVGSKPPE